MSVSGSSSLSERGEVMDGGEEVGAAGRINNNMNQFYSCSLHIFRNHRCSLVDLQTDLDTCETSPAVSHSSRLVFLSVVVEAELCDSAVLAEKKRSERWCQTQEGRADAEGHGLSGRGLTHALAHGRF